MHSCRQHVFLRPYPVSSVILDLGNAEASNSSKPHISMVLAFKLERQRINYQEKCQHMVSCVED